MDEEQSAPERELYIVLSMKTMYSIEQMQKLFTSLRKMIRRKKKFVCMVDGEMYRVHLQDDELQFVHYEEYDPDYTRIYIDEFLVYNGKKDENPLLE